jgi:hypothetical protein
MPKGPRAQRRPSVAYFFRAMLKPYDYSAEGTKLLQVGFTMIIQYTDNNLLFLKISSILYESKLSRFLFSEISDCSEILTYNPGATSGIYTIKLWQSGQTLSVYCDMVTSGGGWTVS